MSVCLCPVPANIPFVFFVVRRTVLSTVGVVEPVSGHVDPPEAADHHEEQGHQLHVGEDEAGHLERQPAAPEHGGGADDCHLPRQPLRERQP